MSLLFIIAPSHTREGLNGVSTGITGSFPRRLNTRRDPGSAIRAMNDARGVKRCLNDLILSCYQFFDLMGRSVPSLDRYPMGHYLVRSNRRTRRGDNQKQIHTK